MKVEGIQTRIKSERRGSRGRKKYKDEKGSKQGNGVIVLVSLNVVLHVLGKTILEESFQRHCRTQSDDQSLHREALHWGAPKPPRCWLCQSSVFKPHAHVSPEFAKAAIRAELAGCVKFEEEWD